MNAEPDTGEGTERPHNHTIDGHHWHDCPGCDDGTPQHEATLRELIHDQSPTHEWCKADGGRGIGDAHYHELVEAVTAFLAAGNASAAKAPLDVERLARAMVDADLDDIPEPDDIFDSMPEARLMAERIAAKYAEEPHDA